MKFTIITAVLMLIASQSTFAASKTPGVDKRQKNQKVRIVQGVKSGELTKKETARLVKGQKQLRKMERKAKADGVVTKKERAVLHAKANKESRKIKRNKHDRQKRGGN